MSIRTSIPPLGVENWGSYRDWQQSYVSASRALDQHSGNYDDSTPRLNSLPLRPRESRMGAEEDEHFVFSGAGKAKQIAAEGRPELDVTVRFATYEPVATAEAESGSRAETGKLRTAAVAREDERNGDATRMTLAVGTRTEVASRARRFSS